MRVCPEESDVVSKTSHEVHDETTPAWGCANTGAVQLPRTQPGTTLSLPATGGTQLLKMPKHRCGCNESAVWDLKHLYLRTIPISLMS